MYKNQRSRERNSSLAIAPGDELHIPPSYKKVAQSESSIGLGTEHFYAELQKPIFVAMNCSSSDSVIFGIFVTLKFTISRRIR